ncbi:MAG: ATP-binding cassette domain-containing protein [archaeon]|nr:ATP-binding cassette domain-containing protein [archaeon]
MADRIIVRGAKVHNLKNVDVDVPLGKVVGITGVSGSGKSSLALGVLYSEGSRRYLDALSTYTRRRMSFATKSDVDEVRHIPAALALRQRPGVPGIRSTFGTGTETLNVVRLMFSRLSEHVCPNGHRCPPSLAVAAETDFVCPECGVKFMPPSAEELSFNSFGACRSCDGTGVVQDVDLSTLVPDETKTIDGGAVLPWGSLMWSLMTDVCRAMGVRTDVPFNTLTPEERDIVFNGPAVKKTILYKSKSSNEAGELDFTYYNAVYTVKNALSKVKDESGMKKVARFLKQSVCPDCGGTRLCREARMPRLRGMALDEVCTMTLSDLDRWVDGIPGSLPVEMGPMAESLVDSFKGMSRRLLDLGLGYLTLDRSASTLSTGERQRMQLAKAVRNNTSGVLYVLDEPSIGLHPANLVGLNGVIRDLVEEGNSVVLVDHDTDVLSKSDWFIEMGPGAGCNGGTVVGEGTLQDLIDNPSSLIGPFLSGSRIVTRKGRIDREVFSDGRVHLSTGPIHTVKPLEVDIPKGRLTVVTGVSGSGKTTLVLESLIPALVSAIEGKALPDHVMSIECGGISRVRLIDATPIGINVRSTVATYSGVLDDLRKLFSKVSAAAGLSYKAGDFSYNTGSLRCPVCDGTGEIDLDVQFLPDVVIPCTGCNGSRYSKEAYGIGYTNPSGETCTLPEIMEMDIDTARTFLKDNKAVYQKLSVLSRLGLGYLTLGEETPGLSGGEAQRLKLATDLGKAQDDTLFVFDEPTIGLHPSDVQVLMDVMQDLIEHGATVVVIEHDREMIRNADYIVDMGPGGGDEGGTVVACGTVDEVKASGTLTGRFI